jgi:hypothetical protein
MYQNDDAFVSYTASIPWKKVGLNAGVFSGTLLLTSLQGGALYPSPLGIPPTSFLFLFVSMMPFVFLSVVSHYLMKDAVATYQHQQNPRYILQPNEVQVRLIFNLLADEMLIPWTDTLVSISRVDAVVAELDPQLPSQVPRRGHSLRHARRKRWCCVRPASPWNRGWSCLRIGDDDNRCLLLHRPCVDLPCCWLVVRMDD